MDKIKILRSKLPLIDLNPLSLPDKSPPIFSSFKLVSVDEIKQLILSSLKSTCLLEPVPSNLLPHCIDSIAQIITRIVNLSLSSGVFPKQLKSALVKPLFKKSNLDPNDLKKLPSNFKSVIFIKVNRMCYSCSSLFASLVP